VTEAAVEEMSAIEEAEGMKDVPVCTCDQGKELALALSPWRKSHCVLLGSILQSPVKSYLGVTARKQSSNANYVISEAAMVFWA